MMHLKFRKQKVRDFVLLTQEEKAEIQGVPRGERENSLETQRR
jgi:hypothetical protein